ncbi:MAG: CocE/NonD family hydrolase, partial [Gemmatimonadota bacterium]|nr:CocE/NonD family hydrolase [Gemmatimonadota bacterium]
PWVHGVDAMARSTVGEREVGQNARIDYDELVLRWMDRWVRAVQNGVEREPPVRVFVMGANRWREADRWPLPRMRPETLYLRGAEDRALSAGGEARGLGRDTPRVAARCCTDTISRGSLNAPHSTLVSDPGNPVTDLYAERAGAHDYRDLGPRPDVLTFETAPLENDVEVIGAINAEIYLSASSPDTDLWVTVLDVAPDGTAFNLMYPGGNVLRASYRDRTARRALLETGRVYLLRLPDLLTANTFKKGHRIRIHLTTTFFPHFSRNLHTGESESVSARIRTSRVTIHHDSEHPSRIIFPVMPKENTGAARRGPDSRSSGPGHLSSIELTHRSTAFDTRSGARQCRSTC